LVAEIVRKLGVSEQTFYRWKKQFAGLGVAEFRKPQSIRVDNGPEFISTSLDLWAYFHGVKLDFSRPGKPTDNAFIESFKGSKQRR